MKMDSFPEIPPMYIAISGLVGMVGCPRNDIISLCANNANRVGVRVDEIEERSLTRFSLSNNSDWKANIYTHTHKYDKSRISENDDNNLTRAESKEKIETKNNNIGTINEHTYEPIHTDK